MLNLWLGPRMFLAGRESLFGLTWPLLKLVCLFLLISQSPLIMAKNDGSEGAVQQGEQLSLQSEFEESLSWALASGDRGQIESVLKSYKDKPVSSEKMIDLAYLELRDSPMRSDTIRLFTKYFSFSNSTLLFEINESIFQGDFPQAEFLLEKLGRDISENDLSSQGGGPLFVAVDSRELDFFLKLLHDSRFNIRQTDHNGVGLLTRAIQSQSLEIARFLMTRDDLEVQSRNSTILHVAAKAGTLEGFRLIYESRFTSDINSIDKSGFTPLILAIGNGEPELVEYILNQSQLDHNNDRIFAGESPLHYAVARKDESSIQILLNSGRFDIDQKNSQGRTPLAAAMSSASFEVVQMLLERGASTAFIESDFLNFIIKANLKKARLRRNLDEDSLRRLHALHRFPMDKERKEILRKTLIANIEVEEQKLKRDLDSPQKTLALDARRQLVHLEALKGEALGEKSAQEAEGLKSWD